MKSLRSSAAVLGLISFSMEAPNARAQIAQTTVEAVATGAAFAANNSIPAVTTTQTTAIVVAIPTVVPPKTPPIVPVGVTPLATARGETTLTLDIAFGIRAVLPSRVSVPVGETLRISAPAMGSTIQWQKNGHAIPGATANPLVLHSVTSADAGTYTAVNNDSGSAGLSSQALILGVGGVGRLLNLSARAIIGPGGDEGMVTGFVVDAGEQPKKLILRAVGPSLALFDVANPLRQPVLRVYDGKGQPYSNGYAYPPVVGGPNYESDLAESLVRAGAFPLPVGTADVVLMMPFLPGAYTAQITSGDGGSGTVLFELYEVP